MCFKPHVPHSSVDSGLIHLKAWTGKEQEGEGLLRPVE